MVDFFDFLLLLVFKISVPSGHCALCSDGLFGDRWPRLAAGFYPLAPVEFFSFRSRLVLPGLPTSSSQEPGGSAWSRSYVRQGGLQTSAP